jgi:alanine racemase
MIVVDISALNEVAVGDEVVLLGVQGGEEISATQMGDLSDTVNYEVITRLNPRILRAYVHN